MFPACTTDLSTYMIQGNNIRVRIQQRAHASVQQQSPNLNKLKLQLNPQLINGEWFKTFICASFVSPSFNSNIFLNSKTEGVKKGEFKHYNSPIAEWSSGNRLLLMLSFLNEGRANKPSGALVSPFWERSISVISNKDSKEEGILEALLCVALSWRDFNAVREGSCLIW